MQRNFGPGEDPLAPTQTWPPADADALLAAGLAVPRPNPLTRQQVKVLQLIADGADDRAIGAALTIEHDTAHSHVRDIMRRLAARTRAQAVAIAMRERWIV